MRAVGVHLPAGLHDRRRHRREASGRASVVDPRARPRRHRSRCPDEEITEALVLCVERTKLLVEGAGAVGLAALPRRPHPRDGPVAVVLSGGNIDATTLISVLRHGLDRGGPVPRDPAAHPGPARRAAQRARPDRGRPRQRRLGRPPPRRAHDERAQTEIEIIVSTRDEEHCQELLASIRDAGHTVERVGPPA